MLSIYIDHSLGSELIEPVATALGLLNVPCHTWDGSGEVPVGAHAVAISECRLAQVRALIGSSATSPRIVVLVASADLESTRRLLQTGADSVIEGTPADATKSALAILAVATGLVAAIPSGLADELVGTVSSPPTELSDEDVLMLSLAATRSIEAAGRAAGLSRRQAQRRYKLLFDRLGLRSHLHAAVATGRWGIATDV